MNRAILFIFLFFNVFCVNAQNVEMIKEDEVSFREYLKINSNDPIEGIYKNLSGTHYKLAIKKKDFKYVAIVLESEDKKWKPGSVKAYIEESSVKNVFSIKWLLADRTPHETIGKLENSSYLSFLLPSGKYGNTKITFLKMYPQVSQSSPETKTSKNISGSGFFISSDGLIATNAHVVEGAKKIEVYLSNDNSNATYKAKLRLIDTNNDVAILKIEDADFNTLPDLPYGIVERADIGEKAFTIGYPLNDIMGSNYKVTDGIISAKSGVEDDIRYYQITVPLQPGNSGGPLFNQQGNVIGITTAKLNGEAIGTSIENVNYAIKVSYLSGLINSLPDAPQIVTSTHLNQTDFKDQVRKLKDYVCLIRVLE